MVSLPFSQTVQCLRVFVSLRVWQCLCVRIPLFSPLGYGIRQLAATRASVSARLAVSVRLCVCV